MVNRISEMTHFGRRQIRVEYTIFNIVRFTMPSLADNTVLVSFLSGFPENPVQCLSGQGKNTTATVTSMLGTKCVYDGFGHEH